MTRKINWILLSIPNCISRKRHKSKYMCLYKARSKPVERYVLPVESKWEISQKDTEHTAAELLLKLKLQPRQHRWLATTVTGKTQTVSVRRIWVKDGSNFPDSFRQRFRLLHLNIHHSFNCSTPGSKHASFTNPFHHRLLEPHPLDPPDWLHRLLIVFQVSFVHRFLHFRCYA